MAGNVKNAIENLEKSKQAKIAHYDMKFVKPLDRKILNKIFRKFSKIITVEDGVKNGGFGSAILEYASKHDYKGDVEVLGIPDEFIEQGSVDELQEIAKINVQGIQQTLESMN